MRFLQTMLVWSLGFLGTVLAVFVVFGCIAIAQPKAGVEVTLMVCGVFALAILSFKLMVVARAWKQRSETER
jgi:uncharacterized membrane protein YhaH (DUF805 family)